MGHKVVEKAQFTASSYKIGVTSGVNNLSQQV